jgi:hypothetical protein
MRTRKTVENEAAFKKKVEALPFYNLSSTHELPLLSTYHQDI